MIDNYKKNLRIFISPGCIYLILKKNINYMYTLSNFKYIICINPSYIKHFPKKCYYNDEKKTRVLFLIKIKFLHQWCE